VFRDELGWSGLGDRRRARDLTASGREARVKHLHQTQTSRPHPRTTAASSRYWPSYAARHDGRAAWRILRRCSSSAARPREPPPPRTLQAVSHRRRHRQPGGPLLRNRRHRPSMAERNPATVRLRLSADRVRHTATVTKLDFARHGGHPHLWPKDPAGPGLVAHFRKPRPRGNRRAPGIPEEQDRLDTAADTPACDDDLHTATAGVASAALLSQHFRRRADRAVCRLGDAWLTPRR
jgi:hypothetical protein